MGNRCVIFSNDGNIVNLSAEEMHEDEGFLKVYSEHNELVAMFRQENIKAAYITEIKKMKEN